MNKPAFNPLLFFSCLLLVTCSALETSLYVNPDQLEELQGLAMGPVSGLDQCKQSLALGRSGTAAEFDSSNIAVLNWNIKKGQRNSWMQDLNGLAADKQLILLQEAALSMGLSELLSETQFGSFSPGYVRKNDITGVMTFSQIEPLARCRLEAIEPWLGTPKSTNVTQYALSNTDQTLVVVNIHAINFSFGLKTYRAQLDEIVEVLSVHEGPIIFSGDFNTWRLGRHNALMESVAKIGMREVQFSDDHRRTFLGMPLDHVFVGGLNILNAKTFEVTSSDHNPIAFTLALTERTIAYAAPGI